MELKSLSATAANVYELCPARYQAEMCAKAPSISGSAANLGTALHRTAQRWVEEGHYLAVMAPEKAERMLRALWDESYWSCFADRARYEEGWDLLLKWHARQDWTGRTVLSTEVKKNFTLTTSAGPIPFNYIMDRVDQFEDGDIEVIDYKSVMVPLTSDDLKQRLQPRAYALAAHLEHPGARRIWVTFDLFRHEPVGVVFTAEECEMTLAYLHALAERILADNEPAEILNSDCRWCIRKTECTKLRDHIRHAGSGIVAGLAENVERRAELDAAKAAIETQLRDLDQAIMDELSQQGLDEAEVGEYRVVLSAPRRRVVDGAAISHHVDYDTFVRLSSVSVTALDGWLRSAAIDAETASLVRRAVAWRYGQRGVRVKRLTA